MPDRPHGNIQTPTEMLTTAKEQRLNNRIYSKTADSGLIVQAIVSELAQELANLPQKADLKNTEQIKTICIAYANACSQAGLIPSKIGLARALGVNRRTLDRFCDVNPQHPTTQLLEIVFDAFSEALSNAALAGATAQVYSIFLGKVLYSMNDVVTVKMDPDPDPLGERVSAEAIAAKYKDLLDSELELPD